MTRHLHEPANALLYKALDLPAEERQRFIADACAGEPELLELVRTLLSRIDELDSFLEAPLDLGTSPRLAHTIVARPGESVGTWRIVRELGRDAIGLIFLVERKNGEAVQTGALKIAPSGGNAAELHAGFQRERHSLSSLKHPGIAGVVDSGTTPDGRPYFVMEHGEGVPIDQYCADMLLGLPQRVALFAPVCRAVYYAHQHLLLHRDLKPANIRVGPDGSARLLNFGLAGDAGEAGGWPPAPLFASPEQLAGQALGIGSDIYSLGAVLYGLLTGRSPNEAEASGIINVLARPAPTRPSDAVAEAAARHYPPLPEFPLDDMLRPERKLASQLHGDLDRILMRAVDLDPAQRYASADEFARDLQRFIDHEPVHAGHAAADEPASAAGPRSLLGVMTAGVVVGALLAGTGLTLWKMRGVQPASAAAEQRLEPRGKLVPGKQSEVEGALEKAPIASREKLMVAAQAYQGELADVLRTTGNLDGAQQAAALSADFAEKLLKSNPDNQRWRSQLSAAHTQVGDVLVQQGRTAEGLAEMRKALALREQLAASNPDDAQAARDVADGHAAIGVAMMATMDYASAERELTLARGGYAALRRVNSGDWGLYAGLLELELARAHVQILQRHGRDAMQTLAALRNLAGDINREGFDRDIAARIDLLGAYIQPRGTPAQAFAVAQQALGELLKHSEKDPLDTYQLRESAMAWQRTGEIGLRAAQNESACRYFGLAAKRYEEFSAAKKSNAIDKLRQGQVEGLRKNCA